MHVPTQITVFPVLGQTFPDANNVLITAAGAIVLTSEYILNAVASGYLLLEDPLGVYLPEDRTDVGGVGTGALAFDVAADLSIFQGSEATPTATTLGALVVGDGGGGDWYWDAADAGSPENVGTVLGSSPAGRWKRLYSGAVNVSWFGARGNGVADDSAAIQAALDGFGHVLLPADSTFLLSAPVIVGSNKILQGGGKTAILTTSASYALRMQFSKLSSVRDLKIVCTGAGTSGIQLYADDTDYCLRPEVSNVTVVLPPSSIGSAVEIKKDGSDTSRIVYMPLISELQVGCSSGVCPGYGVRTSSSVLCSVGGRVTNGRMNAVRFGVHLNHCDTWNVVGTAFDGVVETSPADPTNAGRAVYFGSGAAQCLVENVRLEDCDVYWENVGPANEFHSASGVAPDQIINSGGGHLALSGESTKASVDTGNVTHTRRHLFGRSIEAAFYENANHAGTPDITSLADQSGVVSATVRLTGPTGGFSLSGIKLPGVEDASMYPSGSMKFVYNTTAQTCTVKHESGTATAIERIITLTGADVVVPGPSIMRFLYDDTVGGGGTKRWVYMGAG